MVQRSQEGDCRFGEGADAPEVDVRMDGNGGGCEVVHAPEVDVHVDVDEA